MHIAEENHLSDFQAHFLKEHAQCGKREVFIEFFNRAEEDDLVFHDLDHISTFKNSMLDEFCKLFGHLGFSSGALPSSTLLKGIIESLQKGCSPAVSRDRIAVWIQKLLSSFMWQCYLKYRDDAPPSHSRHSSASSTDDSSDLQLRQNVFLRVPINVVGTGTCPFPTPRSRVRSRSPKHADAKGGSPRPSPKKAAHPRVLNSFAPFFCVDSLAASCYFPMNKTEEQSGMTMEQMEEAGKIEEKKRDAEAAVAQSEAASKKRREGKRVRVPVRFKKPLDSSSPNYRNLTLAMERDGFAEPLVEGSYPSFEVLIYEDDLELLDKFCGVKGLDILDHRMEELPESRSATTIVGDFSMELLLKAIREANPGCFVTGKQVHGKVQDPMMKVFRVLCVVRGPPVWPSVVAGRRPIFAGERSEQFENVPGKTVIVLRPAGCRSVADVMRWFATSGLTARTKSN
ncbi:hypothetical protein PAPYR_10986 [Paratrimastix pyriformis]|uniref:Uncharacterized protein n=1 Tax=Paratrimastix pyriformis TaxID=342808 RepID=A0ABQ8UAF1_9EUKA|nr:hypothetical protein PAPYR_10986 [Paratrimastix pyriformis]